MSAQRHLPALPRQMAGRLPRPMPRAAPVTMTPRCLSRSLPCAPQRPESIGLREAGDRIGKGRALR